MKVRQRVIGEGEKFGKERRTFKKWPLHVNGDGSNGGGDCLKGIKGGTCSKWGSTCDTNVTKIKTRKGQTVLNRIRGWSSVDRGGGGKKKGKDFL